MQLLPLTTSTIISVGQQPTSGCHSSSSLVGLLTECGSSLQVTRLGSIRWVKVPITTTHWGFPTAKKHWNSSTQVCHAFGLEEQVIVIQVRSVSVSMYLGVKPQCVAKRFCYFHFSLTVNRMRHLSNNQVDGSHQPGHWSTEISLQAGSLSPPTVQTHPSLGCKLKAARCSSMICPNSVLRPLSPSNWLH